MIPSGWRGAGGEGGWAQMEGDGGETLLMDPRLVSVPMLQQNAWSWQEMRERERPSRAVWSPTAEERQVLALGWQGKVFQQPFFSEPNERKKERCCPQLSFSCPPDLAVFSLSPTPPARETVLSHLCYGIANKFLA